MLFDAANRLIAAADIPSCSLNLAPAISRIKAAMMDAMSARKARGKRHVR
jgi:hypothetical protein